MADISKLEQQANLLMNNVSGWEQNVLTRIGKRIGRYGKMSLADVKAINNIAVVKQDMEAITKELARVTGLNISQIEQMYGDLLTEQHLANKPLYDYRGKKFVPFAENMELQAIVRAYAKTTGETMINLAKTKALCILDHNGNVQGLQRYYTDVLDKAVMQVTTGAADFHTAMRDSIIELGGSGVRVDYGEQIVRGKKIRVTRRLDTAVRQNLLWGAKQASIAYNEKIGEDLECDGIEIDWHSNPRPSHEGMQGKQYSVVGKKTINGVTYEDAYEQGIDSKDGESGLLNDYGCLHYKTPIILGISEPRYSQEELKRLNEQNAKRYTIDGKEYSGYEVTQMQRRLETAVRNEKTKRDLAKASGDNALVKRCNERIKAYQGKYDDISTITGIQGDKKRMSVPRATTVKGAEAKPSVKTTLSQEAIRERRKAYFERKSSVEVPDFENMSKRELDSYVQKNISATFVSTDGVTTDFYRKAVKSVKKVETEYGTIDGLKVEFEGIKSNSYAEYDPRTKTLHLRKTGNLERVAESMRKADERTLRKYGVPYNAESSYEGTVFHELAHAIDDDTKWGISKELGATDDILIKSRSISFYARDRGMPNLPRATEAAAENISAYFMGDFSKIDKDVLEILKKYFKK